MADFNPRWGLDLVIKKLNSVAATLTGSQTLTNKILTSPVINGGTSSAKDVVTDITADGAITILRGTVTVSKSSAAALTIAAPTTAQSGTILTIISTTAFAHVITFTGGTLINGTSAAKTTATLAAYAGAGLQVVAANQKWNLISNTNATLA